MFVLDILSHRSTTDTPIPQEVGVGSCVGGSKKWSDLDFETMTSDIVRTAPCYPVRQSTPLLTPGEVQAVSVWIVGTPA